MSSVASSSVPYAVIVQSVRLLVAPRLLPFPSSSARPAVPEWRRPTCLFLPASRSRSACYRRRTPKAAQISPSKNGSLSLACAGRLKLLLQRLPEFADADAGRKRLMRRDVKGVRGCLGRKRMASGAEIAAQLSRIVIAAFI